jgi:hypothetical protein
MLRVDFKSDDDAATMIAHDSSEPRIAFAVKGLAAVLGAATGGWRVTLSVADANAEAPLHQEGYSILCLPQSKVVRVIASGTSGVMYGGLRLAELLRHDRVKGKIHRVDPDFGSTLTVSNRDSQSNCWVNWKIMGQPCEFQA